MFLHGSTHDLSVGTILRPGDETGFNNNGGKSEAVYLVMTEGFSLTECENAEGYDNAFEFAVSEALWWGGNEFIYIVQPLGELSYDDNHDVSPACVKTSSARIIEKFHSADHDFDTLVAKLKKNS